MTSLCASGAAVKKGRYVLPHLPCMETGALSPTDSFGRDDYCDPIALNLYNAAMMAGNWRIVPWAA